MFFSVMT